MSKSKEERIKRLDRAIEDSGHLIDAVDFAVTWLIATLFIVALVLIGVIVYIEQVVK